MSVLERALRMGESKQFKQFAKRVDRINGFEPEMELLDDSELRANADELRERASEGEALDDLLPETFALVREAARRSMSMRHFDVQLIGGMVLHDGAIAEMRTGEGKTLTATLAVVLNSLAGKGVHVVTVNDYLARRDAEWMRPVYDLLGVSVGWIDQASATPDRRRAYAAQVTYAPVSEIGFDVLRDRLRTDIADLVAGDPDVALIDEADSVLVDEARVPLVLAGATEVVPVRGGGAARAGAESRPPSVTPTARAPVMRLGSTKR